MLFDTFLLYYWSTFIHFDIYFAFDSFLNTFLMKISVGFQQNEWLTWIMYEDLNYVD